jgi:hypothetical protein
MLPVVEFRAAWRGFVCYVSSQVLFGLLRKPEPSCAHLEQNSFGSTIR